MNSNLKIRPAEPGDDPKVGELLVDSFVSTYAQKMPEVVVTPERKTSLRNVAEKRRVSSVLVAELEGKIVGTVSLYRPGAEDSEAWLPQAADLRTLAVDPDYHGKGISQALLDAVETLAASWGVQAICLHVRRGAHGLERMYRNRGYEREPQGDIEKPSIYLQGFVRYLRPSSQT